MSSPLNNVSSLYLTLSTEWKKRPVNLGKCGELLDQLQVALTGIAFLPISTDVASHEELILARDILEIGCQWAVAVKDTTSFERFMAQLKCYYFDYKNQIPESPHAFQLLGLNLLFLLCQNRVAEFHTELELLPAEKIQSDPYIRHPLALEQYLMEGNYNKIFLAKSHVPAEIYTLFMDILLDTVRGEIATCVEKAYHKISKAEAARRLNVDLKEIINYRTDWKLNKDGFYQFDSDKKDIEEKFPSLELAEQTVSYATELEMIV